VIHFDIPNLEKELKDLEEQTLKEGFWNDQIASNKILAEIKSKKSKVTKYKELSDELENVLELIELLEIEQDESLESEINLSSKKLEKEVEKFELQTLLSGKYDSNNAILTIHPGAGGTESQDWAEMLYRMYSRWATKNGYEVKELDFLEGDEAGIKSVTFEVTGENAYGYLKGEMGVHRLVRISPFDSGGRRHTSFASLEVIPEIEDDVDLYINPDDIKMDVYRASGAGGQHINKTSSAVRLTHIPTGIIVACQTQRSQIQNRENAMKMLKSKLLDLKERENKETIDELKGIQRDIAWGSQIRSYVFCPYTMVKDHRTNYETGNIQAVMDGEIDGFIESYLKSNIK
jgi:peptide chain release factor 2